MAFWEAVMLKETERSWHMNERTGAFGAEEYPGAARTPGLAGEC